MPTLGRDTISITLLLLTALPVSANEGFVQKNCARLGLGIHQKVEQYDPQNGSGQVVVYALFCGVRLEAHGQRQLAGHHTRTAGSGATRHWGYLEYTPTKQSVTRRAVESGERALGTWDTRSRGLDSVVVLHEEPKVVNGNWSYCTTATRGRCRDDTQGKIVAEGRPLLPPSI